MNRIKQHHKMSKGFTLVELLISVVILTLLMFVGSYSYSILSERWNRDLGNFKETNSLAKHLVMLQRSINGVIPLVVRHQQTPVFFFEGSEKSLLAVTSNGLFSNGEPEIFRLELIENKNQKFDLVYQAVSTNESFLLSTEQEIQFTKELIVLKDIDDITFSYLGWDSLAEKSRRQSNRSHLKWYSKYSGIDANLIPEGMKVNLVLEKKVLAFNVHFQHDVENLLSPYISEQS